MAIYKVHVQYPTMARIFGQMAAQPQDVFATLAADRKFPALATASIDRVDRPDIEPALSFSIARTDYPIEAFSDGIEIVVLDEEVRQEDVLLDTRVRRVRLVKVLVGAFGSANINTDLPGVLARLTALYHNTPTVGDSIDSAVEYRNLIGAGEDNTGAYGNFTSARVLTFKSGQESFLGSAVEPLAGEVGISEAPADSKQYVRQNGQWVEVEVQSGPQEFYEFVDGSTAATVRLSARRGALVLTDPFTESVSQIDLGGTTPDPGNIRNVSLNGTGRYTVGASTLLNMNGVITLEYINTPGQFFVINDVDGGNFGPGDRQGFGLVRETIVDGTDLDNAAGPLTTGNSGGWSHQYTWYYSGGLPYGWTTYMSVAQTPGGSGGAATGTFGGQTTNRQWWELCGKAGVGKAMRFGIANGTLTDQSGQDFSNRLVNQMYVSQEMLDHPEAASLLPASVITNGAGWYTQSASVADFEEMGQFPDGNDKGYRFRWSTFGNTTLNQLPYVTGVSNNDQITSASGLSHYVVYNVAAGDKAVANSVLASGVIGPNNRLYAQGTTVDLLQFEQPYSFPATSEGDVFDLKYTYVGPVQASPLFVNYPISTIEEITEAGVSVAPLEKLHASVCEEIRQAVTAYYLIRDFDFNNTALVNNKLADAVLASLGGQLINLYDAVTAAVADDSSPEGQGGVILFPQALKDAILQKLALWMATLPDN